MVTFLAYHISEPLAQLVQLQALRFCPVAVTEIPDFCYDMKFAI